MRRIGIRDRWRVHRWQHPEWWAVLVVGAAWATLVAYALAGRFSDHGPEHSGHAHTHASSGGHDWPTALAWWMVMAAAMMLPLAMRDARWLAHRSLARRRRRTVTLHFAGFFVVWTVAGAVVCSALLAVGDPGSGTATAVLAGAALWHVSPPRRRVFRRCGSGRAPAITGLRADVDCLLAGVRTGRTCLVTCGVAMIAMVATHSLVLMGAVALVGASERRRAPNPEDRAGRLNEAIALAAVAAAVALG